MPTASPAKALAFVDSVKLPALSGETSTLEGVAGFDFDQAKAQAMVVGSDIVSS
jgi:hypothetical protein